ncbi:hypothetical protein BCAR13_740035 [Paraburkholderia caribensis]|nr:hypothetical protein BCAR13_740035 [Paraburkholderia caribensis]
MCAVALARVASARIALAHLAHAAHGDQRRLVRFPTLIRVRTWKT